MILEEVVLVYVLNAGYIKVFMVKGSVVKLYFLFFVALIASSVMIHASYVPGVDEGFVMVARDVSSDLARENFVLKGQNQQLAEQVEEQSCTIKRLQFEKGCSDKMVELLKGKNAALQDSLEQQRQDFRAKLTAEKALLRDSFIKNHQVDQQFQKLLNFYTVLVSVSLGYFIWQKAVALVVS